MTKQSRMTSRHQVILPEDVRDMLDLRPGDLVRFEAGEGRITVQKGTEPESVSFEDRLERARALADPLPLGMNTDEYMSWIREPLPPLPE